MPSAPSSSKGAETMERKRHWHLVYCDKGEGDVSWFEASPAVSLDLIAQVGAGPEASLIDIGGGASRLVDVLLAKGWDSVAVLDISQAAIDMARARIGAAADRIEWIIDDITRWEPTRTYDVWHDRATFHFLTESTDRQALC